MDSQDTDDGIRAIAFDYGGVLAHFIEDEILCHMADAAGVSTEVFSPLYWQLRPGYDNGELGLHDYWHALLDRSNSPVDREMSIPVLAELDGVGWSRMNAAIIRWVFECGRAGYRRLLISNMSESAYEMIIADRSWAKLFEVHIISGLIGMNKPAPGIFKEAWKRTGLSPEEILFLDDSERNVGAACELGMHAVQVTGAAELSKQLQQRFPTVPCESLICRNRITPHAEAR